MQAHDVCGVFPMMSDEEFRGLFSDMAKHGQREPIWTYQGKLLDGRNRLRACKELGIDPVTREWDGKGSMAELVISLNIHRRHLSESQRAMVAAKLKPMFEAEAKQRQIRKPTESNSVVANLPQQNHKSREKAAELLNVSPRSVETASKVIKQGSPELIKAVERGDAKVSAAASVATLPKVEQKRVVEANAIRETAAEVRKGKTLVNGVLVDDPDHIAKKRAAGKIAPDVIPVETTFEPEPESDPAEVDGQIEGFGDAYEGPEESGEEWLAGLPLSSKLKDSSLRWFQIDAMLYRSMESHRKAYAHHATRALKAADRQRQNGPYYRVVKRFLGTAHPRDWMACVEAKEGGCNGTGDLPGIGGKCAKCDGRGFVIVRKWESRS